MQIHKALRLFMSDTLQRLGAVDVDDEASLQPACAQVRSLLGLMRSHVHHENDFVHTAIEARRPGGARRTSDDHVHHLQALTDLDDEAFALQHALPADRAALALRLYRHLAVFVGENLEHMAVEESENNAALWELYRDDELMALHDQLLASVGPEEMALIIRWMAPALTPRELAELFTGMKAQAPAPAFAAMFDVACAQLPESRRAQLARALGLPPVPGLVTA